MMPEWLVWTAAQFSDIITSPIVYVILAGVYWCRNKRFGAMISLSILAGMNMTELLKNSFCVYRPWIRDTRVLPAEQALENASGWSFPSGHTVQATAQFGTMTIELRDRKTLRIAFGVLPLLIGFSRNLLGVHTPQDVLVGLAVGALAIQLSRAAFRWIDSDPMNDVRAFAFCALFCAVSLFYLTHKSYPAGPAADGTVLADPSDMMRDSFMACGSLIGFSGGFALERHLIRFSERAATARLSQIRFLAGGSLMLAFHSCRHALYGAMGPCWGRFAAYGLLFFLVVAVYPWLFTAFERRFFPGTNGLE